MGNFEDNYNNNTILLYKDSWELCKDKYIPIHNLKVLLLWKYTGKYFWDNFIRLN